MIIFAIFGLLVLVFFGFGLCLLFFKETNLHERIIISSAFGSGILGLLLFVLNSFCRIKIDFALCATLLVIFLVTGVFLIYKSRMLLFKKNKTLLNQFRDYWGIKAIILIFVLLILYKSLLFPMVNVDAIGFQGVLAKDIYEAKGLPVDVGPNLIEFTRAYPLFFHILAVWPMVLNQGFNDFFIRLLPPLFSILTLIATYALAMNVFSNDKKKALLSVLLVLMLPMFVNFSVFTNQETMFAFFSVTGVYLIMRYLQLKEPKYLIAGFACLGFSIQTKQLGMFFSFSVFLALLFILFYRKLFVSSKGLSFAKKLKATLISQEMKTLFISIILFLLIIAPFFIRNIVEFNDPIYPFLSASSLHANGKNFVPFLFKPVAEAYQKTSLLYSPTYTLFSGINFVRDKAYSMSVFIAILLIIALFRFRKLKQEQKYLIYFVLFFTAYYAYSFLLKYRYYMAAAPLICIVCAGEFHKLITKGLDKLSQKVFIISLAILTLSLIGYFVVLANKALVIRIIGPMAEHFLAMPDLMLIMNLSVPLVAILAILSLKKPKLRNTLIPLILIVPSVFSLAVINYGLTSDTFTEGFGWVLPNKDMNLFFREVLKPIPSREAVLKLNMEEYYDAIQFINQLPEKSVVLNTGFSGAYYIDKPMIFIDSYKMEKTYNSSLAEALKVLKKNDITHVLYRIPGWDEFVFGAGKLFSQSAVIQNLNNSSVFKPVLNNKNYTLYEIIYS